MAEDVEIICKQIIMMTLLLCERASNALVLLKTKRMRALDVRNSSLIPLEGPPKAYQPTVRFSLHDVMWMRVDQRPTTPRDLKRSPAGSGYCNIFWNPPWVSRGAVVFGLHVSLCCGMQSLALQCGSSQYLGDPSWHPRWWREREKGVLFWAGPFAGICGW